MSAFPYDRLVLVVVVTAVWDVILRFFATRTWRLFGIEDWNWVRVLRPYFEHHTVLGAALLAGFAGAAAYVLIRAVDTRGWSQWKYLVWVAVASALVGVPMRYSGLFPYLKRYYYDPLPITTIFSDAFSGVVVAITIGVLQLVAAKIY